MQDAAGQLLQVRAAARADHQREFPDALLQAHRQHRVAGAQHRVVVRHAELAVVVDPRDHHAEFVDGGNVLYLQAVEVPVLHRNAGVGQGGGGLVGVYFAHVLLGLGPEQAADNDHRKDDAQDGAGVGQRVAHRGGVGGLRVDRGQRLLRGGQRRGIGDRAGVHADGGGDIEAGQPRYRQRDGYAAQHHGRGQQIELQPLLLEGGEEARPHLRAYGIDEKDEAEVAQELQRDMVYGEADVAGQDAGEQHPGYAEIDAGDLYVPDSQARRRHHHDDEHRPGHGFGGEKQGEEVHI